MDATLAIFWLIYLRFLDNIDRMKVITAEYPEIFSIFQELHDGLISNIMAKDRLIDIFLIDDPPFIKGEFVKLTVIHEFVKLKLSHPLTVQEDSTFTCTFEISWVCPCCSHRKFNKSYDYRNRWEFSLRIGRTSLQESIDLYLTDSSNPRICSNCHGQCTVSREVIRHPIILHLTFPIEIKVAIPNYLD